MSDYRRYAIYYTPPKGDFADFGAIWLGWDPVLGRAVAQPRIAGLDLARITAGASRYGFHATLKAPFRLAAGHDAGDLAAAAEHLAEKTAPVTLPGLVLARLGSFLALVPAVPGADLQALAAGVVAGLDGLRAPLTGAERARRRPEQLAPAQRAYLEEWGYPYVMTEFRFHMTLSDGLEDDLLTRAEASLRPRLRMLPAPLVIDALSLMGEAADGRFHLITRLPLRGA
ncbi:MAG: DUF1045 domain-containing protein [Paracoccus sp. (in: a-proteobacteria)]|nr:DUF1045 domain-containing protein [Paracoccus sp. (in: a-proteobacteria)]